MKYMHSALALACTTALAACGGGSNGSDHTTPQHDNNHHAGSGHTNTTSSESHTGNNAIDNGKITGHYLVGDENSLTKTSQVQPGNNIDTIIINNQAITLIPDSVKTKSYYEFEDNNQRRIIGANLNYARYGFLWNKAADKGSYFIYQGYATANMPNQGTAVYQGNAVHLAPKYDGYDAYAAFSVDFGQKKLNGKISGNGRDLAILKADIKGNTFSGNYNGTTTDGQFYGPDAAELAGTYMVTNEPKTGGTFGAAKQ